MISTKIKKICSKRGWQGGRGIGPGEENLAFTFIFKTSKKRNKSQHCKNYFKHG
jgi:hypothetical protein